VGRTDAIDPKQSLGRGAARYLKVS